MQKTEISTAATASIMSVSTGMVLKLIKRGDIKARRNAGPWPNAGYAVEFGSVLDFVQKRRTKRK